MELEPEETALPINLAERRKAKTNPISEPPIGTFLDGTLSDLTPASVETITAITTRLGGRLPEITSNDRFAIVYYEPNGFNFSRDSVSVTVNSVSGAVVDGGYGREWWGSHPDNPIIKALLDEFGPGAAMTIPPRRRSEAREGAETGSDEVH